MKTLYEFKDYKRYLITVLGAGKVRSGLRAKLAERLSCQTAYVSQVLNGNAHFSFEQGYKINSFLGHDREESHFFILLMSRDRSGTRDLREYYQVQLDEILTRRAVIKNRVKSTEEVPREHQSRYYSAWHYLAIHVALSIPQLQTKDALAKHFHLPLALVAEALEFLLSAGLAAFEGGRYIVGPSHVHLGHDSDNVNKHHLNWRIQGMDSLNRLNPADLHYSVVYSLSYEDAEKIRERILQMIKANLKDVEPSKTEALFCTSLDFFEMRKS